MAMAVDTEEDTAGEAMYLLGKPSLCYSSFHSCLSKIEKEPRDHRQMMFYIEETGHGISQRCLLFNSGLYISGMGAE